ncbi:similar to Saccharomyces cerevisiae YDL001W RMD1 Cytoplasmic protein required for sporulation [Maudiozyma barnettii]|uniref:Similar to Saccharomyces cerevisiae YDL001W RMD1 Cytoplasmic protein required for sporulation n=1 Tax=Maudiozyma barnettii TaxID=61262 RepID=A0A8H2ZFF4_9SACH|nr:Rmd1p [Kazachstania barnettii]CAB4253166.1 similar to Saccharomyces cerevisiae YDL001W RMD1 Cytoplasmic protein required for sporulation [Kazachstania barnettii]CAD1780298.1 similar to Saccharomyces cerevisiae YDL001W RMD1 Cytoplasmic protein required for sporulation [Kazachstania barnettii]
MSSSHKYPHGSKPEQKPLLSNVESRRISPNTTNANASKYIPKDSVPLIKTKNDNIPNTISVTGNSNNDSDDDDDDDDDDDMINRERVTSSRYQKGHVKGKVGPQRTSRTAQKLKLLPEEPFQRKTLKKKNSNKFLNKTNSTEDHIPSMNTERYTREGDDNEEEDDNDQPDRDVYSQVNRIKDKSARRDAEKLGKKHRRLLPRCTAYSSASSYNMRELMYWMKDTKKIHHTHPKLFDECLYTPFMYTDWRGDERFQHENLIRIDDEGGEINVSDKQPDLFIFEYGVVVMWGFTETEEKSFLMDIERFEKEKLAEEDVQIEEFNYYVTQSYQPRIYNDFITLRDGSNYMVKLSISHAIAQSVKISLFEELVENTIDDTQDIPQEIASSGKVSMSKEDIMKSIGELFILRININLHGSVLDSPEIMWSEPQLEPIYQATRGYLEINQRVALLNQRLEVISDLLQMLKEQLGHSHEEYLEFIVIVLVGVEVLISGINIAVDMIAGK